MLFHPLLEVAESNRTFWLNWKRPLISSTYWAYNRSRKPKKKLRQDKETIQLSTCVVFDLSFFILYLLHLYRYTCKMNLSTCIIPDQFFFSCYDVLTTRLKVHIWLTHMKTRILCIFTPSLHRQRCTWRCTCFCKCLIITCNFISLNSFLSSLARNTINVISVSSLIQMPVFSMQKRAYFHSSMVYLVFQIWIIMPNRCSLVLELNRFLCGRHMWITKSVYKHATQGSD